MKNVLNRLIAHETISTEEAKQIIVNISNDMYNLSQIACFLSVYLMRSITIEELRGFRDALLELCIPIDLSDYNAIDIVGTGGDGKNTFNISTLSSSVLTRVVELSTDNVFCPKSVRCVAVEIPSLTLVLLVNV